MSRLDRYGDPVTEPHHCDNGWDGEDTEGRPRPCYQCRPQLAPSRRRYQAGLIDYPPTERTTP